MKRGFTLVELMVAITIIAVITAVGAVSYGGVTKKSRDSRRMADLEKYRISLEVAKQVGSTYPATLSVLMAAPYNLLSGTMADPKSGFTYYYHKSTNYVYELYAQMEDAGSTNVSGPAQCGGTGNCNYKVTNP